MSYYGVDRRPTEKEEKLIRVWLDEYKTPFELIKRGLPRTCRKNKWSCFVGYTNGILKNWHENGINTIEAVEQMDKQFSNKIENNENSKGNTEVIKNSFNNFNQRVYTDEEIMARLAEKNKKR
ncbi:MAG: DnaD domain-containing protein [Lachnospirales bacterium]